MYSSILPVTMPPGTPAGDLQFFLDRSCSYVLFCLKAVHPFYIKSI